jgi:hypothetical protein
MATGAATAAQSASLEAQFCARVKRIVELMQQSGSRGFAILDEYTPMSAAAPLFWASGRCLSITRPRLSGRACAAPLAA